MTRGKTLGRILELYRTVEGVRRTEAAVAAQDVLETERGIRQQRDEMQQARSVQRDALEIGDEITLAISSARQQMAHLRSKGLGQLLGERRQKSEAAKLRYVDSLQWKERMESLVAMELDKLRMEQERREQVAADDRYLARRGTRSTVKVRKSSALDESSLIRGL